MNRIDRLMALLTTLQSKKYVTAEYIAEKYEISIRTVYRDIKALEEIGVPVYFENHKGYTILRGFFLPPVSLTGEEANALILIASLAGKFADGSVKKLVGSALDKIKSVMRPSDREKADLIHSQIRVFQPANITMGDNYLVDIQNAIVDRKILKIEYINNLDEKSTREIEPIGMKFYSNQWHLIAWCWKRNEYRDFKVQKITSLENTYERFRKTDHYDLKKYMDSLKSIIWD